MSNSNQLLNTAMLWLAEQPKTIFVGQNVEYDGNVMYRHLDGVPKEKRLEFPVAEELQLGCCIGLAMQGFVPICIFPRIDFMLRAADQLVNHLDKIETMSCGQWCPKVIIRTAIGKKTPLDAGPQHTGRYTESLRMMLTTVRIIELTLPDHIVITYREAIANKRSTIVVEDINE